MVAWTDGETMKVSTQVKVTKMNSMFYQCEDVYKRQMDIPETVEVMMIMSNMTEDIRKAVVDM